MKLVNLSDNLLIKRIYKQADIDDHIDEYYIILLDGNVVDISGFIVKTFGGNAVDMNMKIRKFGGDCPTDDGGIILGNRVKDEWCFKCTKCDFFEVCGDEKVDEIVHNAILSLEK